MLLHWSDRRGAGSLLYVGVQVHARTYYVVRVRVYSLVHRRRGTAVYIHCCRYRCRELSECNDVNAIILHKTIVSQPLDHPIFHYRHFAFLQSRLFAIRI